MIPDQTMTSTQASLSPPPPSNRGSISRGQGDESVRSKSTSRRSSQLRRPNSSKSSAKSTSPKSAGVVVKKDIPVIEDKSTGPNTNKVEIWEKVIAMVPEEASVVPDMTYNAEGMTIRQLPWTDDDTKQVMAQIKFMQEELLGGRGAVNENIKLWKEGLNDLKHRLEATMSGKVGGGISREDPLLKRLLTTMRAVNLVDLPKLVKLMKNSQNAGDCMEARDVILLCGETGAGKTTTLHYLIGTFFEEIEIDGFVHLNPTVFVDEAHKNFKTAYNREPTTRVLQAATTKVKEGQDIVICDVPGYDVSNCLEEDIALGMGLVNAVRRARSIRPVVVLSREGMGNRFSNLPETMRIVSRLCNVTEKADWVPFNYVFAKYEERHRKMLHKQFAALRRNPPKCARGQDQSLFEAFIEDIAEKTNPDAHVILPLGGQPANVLSSLYHSPLTTADPQDLCAAFASDFALKQMHLQMDVNLHSFRGLLLQEDYLSAVKTIKEMIDMSEMFPDMQPYIHQAKEAFLQQVAQIWVLVVRSVGKQDYHTALYRMEQLSTIAKDFPDAVQCSELGHEMLSQSIAEPIAEQLYEGAIERMIRLSKLRERFSEASQVVSLGLQLLKDKLVTIINAKQYTLAVGIIQKLGRAEADIPDAFAVAQQSLHMVNDKLMRMIEEEGYTEGIELTMHMSNLGRDFAEANAYVRRILKLIRKRIDQMIELEDYSKAAYLLGTLKGLGTSLYDGADYVAHAFDTAAHHVCELRMEVVNAFEALLQAKDQKQFSQLLEYGLAAMNNLMKSEQMRQICAEFYSSRTLQEDQSGTFKPNYLEILCTPKDCTSEAFCVAQVKHLLETVSNELTLLGTDNMSVDYLMSHRKPMLSVVLRLRAAQRVFKLGPGGNLAAKAYEEAFSKFQALIESILALSEASFDSSMEMKEFEFQTWFLAFMIQGFTKESTGNERGEDSQAVEELDHRRVTLMLRFENEISDTVELLANYDFPAFHNGREPPNFAAFFEEVKMGDLEAPRQLLLSLSQAPQLCKMMATLVSAKEAEKSVAKLDKSLVHLFADIVECLENSYYKLIHELKTRRISFQVGLYDANKMCADIDAIRPEAMIVQGWSDGTMKGLEPILVRLAEIEDSVRILINKLDNREIVASTGGPFSYFLSMLSFAGLNDGTWGCACLGGNTQDDFMISLPELSKREDGLAKDPTWVSTSENDGEPEALVAIESTASRCASPTSQCLGYKDDSNSRAPTPIHKYDGRLPISTVASTIAVTPQPKDRYEGIEPLVDTTDVSVQTPVEGVQSEADVSASLRSPVDC